MITVLVYPPKTNTETVFVACIMVCNCAIFGFTINLMGAILEDIKRYVRDIEKEINILGNYMISQSLSKDL